MEGEGGKEAERRKTKIQRKLTPNPKDLGAGGFLFQLLIILNIGTILNSGQGYWTELCGTSRNSLN